MKNPERGVWIYVILAMIFFVLSGPWLNGKIKERKQAERVESVELVTICYDPTALIFRDGGFDQVLSKDKAKRQRQSLRLAEAYMSSAEGQDASCLSLPSPGFYWIENNP
jgi:hypothetical protein